MNDLNDGVTYNKHKLNNDYDDFINMMENREKGKTLRKSEINFLSKLKQYKSNDENSEFNENNLPQLKNLDNFLCNNEKIDQIDEYDKLMCQLILMKLHASGNPNYQINNDKRSAAHRAIYNSRRSQLYHSKSLDKFTPSISVGTLIPFIVSNNI